MATKQGSWMDARQFADLHGICLKTARQRLKGYAPIHQGLSAPSLPSEDIHQFQMGLILPPDSLSTAPAQSTQRMSTEILDSCDVEQGTVKFPIALFAFIAQFLSENAKFRSPLPS